MSASTFMQSFWKRLEEGLEKCIWFLKVGMLACHKSNYINYINLSPRYSNLVATNLTTVVCQAALHVRVNGDMFVRDTVNRTVNGYSTRVKYI